jgi:hypothetical protein
MKRFLNGQSHMLIVLIGGLLAITFLVHPVLAQEMSPSEKLKKANELAAEASDLATEARETGDVLKTEKALELANEASKLVKEVTATARDTGNAELAQAALDASNNIVNAINLVIASAENIAQTSTDPGKVAAAEKIKTDSETARDDNNANIRIAINSGANQPTPGAEGFTPTAAPTFDVPVGEEPPIQDTQPASLT